MFTILLYVCLSNYSSLVCSLIYIDNFIHKQKRYNIKDHMNDITLYFNDFQDMNKSMKAVTPQENRHAKILSFVSVAYIMA